MSSISLNSEDEQNGCASFSQIENASRPRSGRPEIRPESEKPSNLSRPLHGLFDKSRPDPSTKVLGYFHIVQPRTIPIYAFLGKGYAFVIFKINISPLRDCFP
jgi:hypothetical protein